MSLTSVRTGLTARWVFPVESPPIDDGAVIFDGSRIVAVGPREALAKELAESHVVPLGNAAILPGLVNAHTHLEFSELDDPLGEPNLLLPWWIRRVIRYRRERDRQRQQLWDGSGDMLSTLLDRGLVSDTIRLGLDESTRLGTTMLGEIATLSWRVRARRVPIDVTLFFELLGLSGRQMQTLVDSAEQALEQLVPEGPWWRAGLSPHAPYTVHPQLVARLAKLSSTRRVPMAFHLAESREELELLHSHSGAFVELLQEVQAWDPRAFAQGSAPLDYLKLLSLAHRVLVIHGNYLAPHEISYLAEHARTMSVVYCPRTHHYFGHPHYPLRQMLSEGVAVALGTDSRASNPDLSVLGEMRFVAQRHHDVPLDKTLELGTLAGARALGRDQEAGSLRAGKFADLAVVALAENAGGEPHQQVLHGAQPVVRTYFRGQLVFHDGEESG